MTTFDFLKSLAERHISVRLKDDQLAVSSQQNEQLDPEVLAELRARKAELIQWLQRGNALQTPVNRAPVQESYELSAAQRRLWILSQLDESGIAFNIPYVAQFSGDLQEHLLQEAFHALVVRHESLRTRFFLQGAQPMQRIHEADPAFLAEVFQVVDGPADQNALDAELRLSIMEHRFDPVVGPLIKVRLYRMGEQQYLLGLVLHHIIADAWSIRILIEELVAHYQELSCGTRATLLASPIQYKDFAYWQNQQLAQGQWLAQEAYWKDVLNGELPILELPVDFPRPVQKKYRGGLIRRSLSPKLAEHLRLQSRQEHATLFQALLASVFAFFHRFTGSGDLLLGTTSAGRNRAEWQSQIGCFVQVLPLRHRLEEGGNFRQLLQNSRDMVAQVLNNEDFPFNLMLEKFRIPTPVGRNPVFDVLVEFIGAELEEEQLIALDGLQLQPYEADAAVSKFDLAFRFFDREQGLELLAEYDSSLFRPDTVDRLISFYLTYLEELCLDPSRPVMEVDFMTTSERAALYQTQSPVLSNWPVQQTILDYWDQQWPQFAERPAVVGELEQLSFQQFDRLSDAVALHLRQEYGVEPGDTVALLANRSPKITAAIWGVIKAGAVFLPVDPQYPSSRLELILGDAGAKVLILESPFLFQLPAAYEGGIAVVDLISDEIDPEEAKAALAGCRPSPSSLAYILYTSGSTGLPKGVEISHENLMYYLFWANQYYFQNRSNCPFALFTSLSFDLSMTGLLGTPLRGDTLYLYEETQDMPALLRKVFAADSPVRSVKLTPSHLSLLRYTSLESSRMEVVIAGGEALQPTQVQNLFELNPELTLHNEYGPTETTVGCTVETLQAPAAQLSIGYPIAGAQIYLFDPQQRLLPPGMAGEIGIAGPGLARGYRGRPELSRERFVCLHRPDGQLERVYLSGDLGRRRPDGRIEYLGRKDQQVKIRGHRVELAEVEAALLKVAGVREALVLVRRDERGDNTLAAYLSGPSLPSASGLRNQLESQVPVHMIPSLFFQLQDFPLSTNGKIDTEALLHSSKLQPLAEEAFHEAKNEVESWLSGIFAELLGLPGLSVQQHLFTLGLDSLKVVVAQSQIETRFPGVLQIHEIFSHPTVRKMAILLTERNGGPSLIQAKAQILDF